MQYDKATPEERAKYAGRYVWQVPVTSHYPEQGFRIPYHLYHDQPEIMGKIALFPENERNFKYAMRQMSDDDALEVVERALEVIDVLQYEIGDTSEDWNVRRTWLQSLVGELWTNRGCYPGMTRLLNVMNLKELNLWYKKQTLAGKEKEAFGQIRQLILEGKKINGVEVNAQLLGNLQGLGSHIG